ncbi:HU family DNA-binding protein [Bacteroides sp.]
MADFFILCSYLCCLNHITYTIRDRLYNEESVTLVGFGTFRVQEYAAR